MDTAARIEMVTFFIVTIVAQQIIAHRAGTSRRTKTKSPMMILELSLKISGSLLLAAFIAGASSPLELPAALRGVGFVLIPIGAWITLWAQTALGSNWIPGVGLRHSHRLVAVGPYRRVRHPLYSGIGLALVGMVLAASDKAVAIGSLMYWISLVSRIPREEILLGREFGEAYAQLARQTGIIFPRFRSPRAPEYPPREVPVVAAVAEVPRVKRPPTNVARREQARRAKRKRH